MGQRSGQTSVASEEVGPGNEAGSGPALSQCPTCGGEFDRTAVVCPRDRSPLERATPDALRDTVLGGTYRIVRRIAVGGMGRVYEAKHERLPQRFAVKVLHQSQAHRPEAVQRFEREALETSRLRSEHVLEIVDLLRTADGRPCLVAELLEGETLQERLDRAERMDVDRAIAVAIELCRGLAVAHEHGIIHRDLKPSNIFLVPAGEREVAKLVDFGVAKVDDRRNLTQTGAFVGTPAYMAPEQAAGATDLDHRADVYSIGAVLYHMISGEPPYGREDAAATLRKLLTDEPPRVRSVDANVPPGLEAIIEQAMAREPSARYASVDELCDELVQLARLRGGAVVAHGPDARNNRDRRARWLRPSAIGLLAATSVIAAAWVAALGRSIVFSFAREEQLAHWHRLAFVLVPLAAGLLVLGAGLRRLVRTWRSGPRVQGLVVGFRRLLGWGMGLLALAQLALASWRSWAVDSTATAHGEHAIALGVAGVAAAIAFAVSQRRGG